MTTDCSSPHPGVDAVTRFMGRRLLQRRKSLHLSRPQLAARLNITPSTLRAWEEGAACLDAGALFEAARCLGVSLDYFVEDFPSPCRGSFATRPAEERTEILRWLDETLERGR